MSVRKDTEEISFASTPKAKVSTSANFVIASITPKQRLSEPIKLCEKSPQKMTLNDYIGMATKKQASEGRIESRRGTRNKS